MQHLEQKNIVHRDLAARQASSAGTNTTATPAREAGSGMATGRRQHEPVTAMEPSTGKPKMSNAQSNPMYKDDGKSGTNPLYEGDKRVQSGLNTAAGATASGAAITKSRSNIQNNRVATGDVNGDGKPDTGAAEPQKATINTTRSNIKHQKASEKSKTPQYASINSKERSRGPAMSLVPYFLTGQMATPDGTVEGHLGRTNLHHCCALSLGKANTIAA
jgi:hypothetical protein